MTEWTEGYVEVDSDGLHIVLPKRTEETYTYEDYKQDIPDGTPEGYNLINFGTIGDENPELDNFGVWGEFGHDCPNQPFSCNCDERDYSEEEYWRNFRDE